MRRRVAAFAAACLLFGVSGAAWAVDPTAEDPPSRPNIVVFYIDDVSPHDGRLWDSHARTPNIHEHFVQRGIEFTNAIGEFPLCCPARGNLLTGLHTHNNFLTENDASLFDPSEHIGHAMKDAGYAAMFIGKYLNRNSSRPPRNGWSTMRAGRILT